MSECIGRYTRKSCIVFIFLPIWTMENHPTTYPHWRVSYYNTKSMEQPMIDEMFRRDKQSLNSAWIDFSIEDVDWFTFIVVEWCSSYELAMEILA